MRPTVARAAGSALLVCSLVLAGVSFPECARAQAPGARQQAAEALFQQGRELLEVGNYTAACQKLEASQKLDPGLGTLLFLGECYDKLGRSASAWRAFADAAVLASQKGDEDRGRLARIRASALEPTVPQLRVRVAAATRALDAVEYTLNGVELAVRDLDRSLSVDPGRTLLRVTAPGHERWETQLEILEGPSTAVVDVPELALAKPSRDAAGLGTPLASPRVVSVPAAPAPPADSSGSGVRTASVIIAGVGLAAAGVGAYFAVRAVDEAEQAKAIDHCPLPDRCYEDGIELRDQARSHAHIADLAMGVGAALFVGGVVLYLVAPEARSDHPGVASADGARARGSRVIYSSLPGGSLVTWEMRW